MAGWDKGPTTIDALIGSGEIERVPASRHAAEAELARARTHVDSVARVLGTLDRVVEALDPYETDLGRARGSSTSEAGQVVTETGYVSVEQGGQILEVP